MPPIRQSDVDACPGALRLHAAADGPLARIRLPGGILSGTQLALLGELARTFGDGHLELTSRANIQLRALQADEPAGLAARLSAAGLLPSRSHETVRNIAAPALADEPTRALVHELDRTLCADPALAALPGRFLFAVGDVPLDADVAAVPAVPADADTHRADPAAVNEDAGARDADAAGSAPSAGAPADEPVDRCFAVLFAGVDAGLRIRSGEVVGALLAAAHAFLAERGDRPAWRLRELPDGPARVARRTADALDAALAPAYRPVRAVAGPTPLLGVVPQGDGRVAVGATVPLGRLGGVPIRVLARAERVVVTPWRGVVVPDLTPRAASAWRHELAAAGLAVEPDSRWSGVTACAGKPGCAKSLADVRADADAATRYMDGLPVHWIGCARGCGSPAGGHVRVEATPAGYVVSRQPDGSGGGGPQPAAAADRLGDLVAEARRC